MQKFIFYFQYRKQTENVELLFWNNPFIFTLIYFFRSRQKCFHFIKPIWEVIRRKLYERKNVTNHDVFYESEN